MRPRLLADMNISPKTVDALRQRGWDIIRVSQALRMDASDDVTVRVRSLPIA